MAELTCAICWEDVSAEDGSLVEYRTAPEAAWHPVNACESCLRTYINAAYSGYFEAVQKADCARNLRRLLESGPPTYFNDKAVCPLDDGQHVHEFRFSSTATVESGLVPGAKTNGERQQIWDELVATHQHRLDELPELTSA